jgi:hypothetical protein
MIYPACGGAVRIVRVFLSDHLIEVALRFVASTLTEKEMHTISNELIAGR